MPPLPTPHSLPPFSIRDDLETWRRKYGHLQADIGASKKADVPGGIQRRKHQITYLAAQAKARQQDLENQWAASASARKAAAQRYGFK